ncbi:hypothetical protein F5148DRAFT_472660 [Russula earlei]|uniref:Uncharacterized protein n=1 Tax=Russula earlei TaxID=71964 RepID=A0ACC0UIS7_9AGAM|nr:hypothetical protein F5148DRAFT_472660 [Russula earlei]
MPTRRHSLVRCAFRTSESSSALIHSLSAHIRCLICGGERGFQTDDKARPPKRRTTPPCPMTISSFSWRAASKRKHEVTVVVVCYSLLSLITHLLVLVRSFVTPHGGRPFIGGCNDRIDDRGALAIARVDARSDRDFCCVLPASCTGAVSVSVSVSVPIPLLLPYVLVQ